MPNYKQISIPQCIREDRGGLRNYVTPEGNRYPSITTILSIEKNEGLEDWKASVGEEAARRISSRAAHRGTFIHKMCENLIKNVPLEHNMFYNDMWESFKPIVEKIDDVFALETPLYSDYLKVAGTVDCVGIWNGKLSIIDFKTSSRRKTTGEIGSYFMQEAAYAVCWEELTGKPITQLVTLMAVEDEEPLVFIEHRDSWIRPFFELRKLFGQLHGR